MCAALAASAPELEAALAAKVAAEVAEADRKAPIAATGGGRGGSCAQGGLNEELLGIAPARLTIALQVSGADALHNKLASASLSDARHVVPEFTTM